MVNILKSKSNTLDFTVLVFFKYNINKLSLPESLPKNKFQEDMVKNQETLKQQYSSLPKYNLTCYYDVLYSVLPEFSIAQVA